MISLKGVSKSFDSVKAVDTVSIDAFDKEILVLLGVSGCGKTTTLKMINRLVEPDNGSIIIDGRDIRDNKPEALRKTIGFVMQHAGLFPHYTIAQNIAVVPELLGWEKKRVQDRTRELLQKLHLDESLLSHFPHELSGGQQQRVGIARALIADTPVLLMDEPFGALDGITKAAIHSEFKTLDELKNKTIILVTHDIVEAFELGARICLMDKGHIIQIGTPIEILYRPANNFVKEFFAHNRLMLEYKIAGVKSVEPFLKQRLSLKAELKLSTTLDVWSALQILSSDSKYNADYELLLSAFNEYRKLQTL